MEPIQMFVTILFNKYTYPLQQDRNVLHVHISVWDFLFLKWIALKFILKEENVVFVGKQAMQFLKIEFTISPLQRQFSFHHRLWCPMVPWWSKTLPFWHKLIMFAEFFLAGSFYWVWHNWSFHQKQDLLEKSHQLRICNREFCITYQWHSYFVCGV